ncbi:stage VI sporulation protein D [Bacillus marasmi]|uniref:stage VI sporulation protein D n=1 Tax=Bacillus marasmi TaxID=1926279 RepID=UPI0011CA54FA|nr:stage VI sporulation protein D [Bacillus marasmi]
MSQENQSFLRFSLEESVWFQKGQEVAELLSISLDPNITIIENDQYVAIRGSLELTGEYKRVDEESVEQDELISTPKFVQSVEEREEGFCEFLHRFPVDITIPNNRIQSVYDIDVSIDSFDYAVPERSCLRLVAELTISGLYGEQQNVPIEEDEQVQDYEVVRSGIEVEEQQEESKIEEEVEIPQYQRLESDQVTEEEEELEPLYRSQQEELTSETENQSYSPNFVLSYPSDVDEDDFDLEDEEEERSQYDYSRPFTAEAKLQPEAAEEEEHEDNPFAWVKPSASSQPSAPPPPELPKFPEYSFSAKRSEQPPQDEQNFESPGGAMVESPQFAVVESPEHESSSSSSPEKQSIMQKLTKKKSMSIAEFLARKTENELQAKLKVCIVQQGDTLDSLSDRYDISVQQIMRVNHLEANQGVYEGQVLYIPETATSK